MEAHRQVGIREVARLAGVSRQTVSRVVNDHPSIRPETRERVQKVIDEVGYRPNRIARMLGANRSRTLGVIVSNLARSGSGPATALQGIEAAAHAAGYLVHITSLSSHSPQDIEECLALQMDMRVDGLVIIAPQLKVLRAVEELAPDLPYVMLNSRHAEDPNQLFVDQVGGARAATRHLLELGHRCIAHIAGPQDWLEADARMHGYLRELAAWDVEPLPPVLGDWTADFGYVAGLEIARRPEISAVFAANDSTALGLMHALHERGLDVPGDVSVVGYDDIPEAAHFWPPLTTVAQDFAELGRRCVAQLLDDQTQGSPLMLPPHVVVRQSTAPPVDRM